MMRGTGRGELLGELNRIQWLIQWASFHTLIYRYSCGRPVKGYYCLSQFLWKEWPHLQLYSAQVLMLAELLHKENYFITVLSQECFYHHSHTVYSFFIFCFFFLRKRQGVQLNFDYDKFGAHVQVWCTTHRSY